LEVFEVERKIKIEGVAFIKGLFINYWKFIIGLIFSSGLIAWLVKKLYKKIKKNI